MAQNCKKNNKTKLKQLTKLIETKENQSNSPSNLSQEVICLRVYTGELENNKKKTPANSSSFSMHCGVFVG